MKMLFRPKVATLARKRNDMQVLVKREMYHTRLPQYVTVHCLAWQGRAKTCHGRCDDDMCMFMCGDLGILLRTTLEGRSGG